MAVKKFLVRVSLDNQDRVLVLCACHRCCNVVRILEKVEGVGTYVVEALVRSVLLPVERSLSNSLTSAHKCPLWTQFI